MVATSNTLSVTHFSTILLFLSFVTVNAWLKLLSHSTDPFRRNRCWWRLSLLYHKEDGEYHLSIRISGLYSAFTLRRRPPLLRCYLFAISQQVNEW